MSTDWYQDVLDFHRKLGIGVGNRPAAPDLDTLILREQLMREELTETIHASAAKDPVGVADGCADLIYVAVGTAISWGIDLRPIWRIVHASNMAKAGGGRRDDGKILKPPGWQAPDVAGILRAQGWEGGK
jgi:predicted HAD superfamily Cof-like phosphohydrolase